MKITWKLFFSTVITMIVTFCLAGYFLISALFQSGYEQAVDGAINVDQLFLHEFGNYMVGVSKEEDADRQIAVLADELLMENIQVHIQKEDGTILYSNTSFPKNKIEVKAEAEGMTRRLVNYEGNYYIQVKSRVTVEDIVYQAVLFHDVTDLFIKRQEEIQIYHRFLILFLLLDGLVSLILAGCIVRPIKKISRSAGRIWNTGSASGEGMRSAVWERISIVWRTAWQVKFRSWRTRRRDRRNLLEVLPMN